MSTESDILPYWLSNASALLCLLQKNLRSNGFLKTPVRHSISSPGTFQRITNVSHNFEFLTFMNSGISWKFDNWFNLIFSRPLNLLWILFHRKIVFYMLRQDILPYCLSSNWLHVWRRFMVWFGITWRKRYHHFFLSVFR